MSKATTKDNTIRGKVTPSLITAAILSLVTTLIPGGWSWVFAQCHRMWEWLVGDVTVPVWLLALLSLISLVFLVAVGFFIYAATRKPEADIADRYAEDTIFEIRWRWSYGQHGIYGLCSFCPRCDMQVFARDVGAFSALDRVVYHCDDCGTDLNRFQFGREEVESRVTRKIHQRIRKENREKETHAA